MFLRWATLKLSMVTSCWGSLAFRQLFLQRAQPMGLVLSASLSVGVYLLGLFCLISLWPRNHWLRMAFSIGMALSWIILSHFFSSIWAIFYYYYFFFILPLLSCLWFTGFWCPGRMRFYDIDSVNSKVGKLLLKLTVDFFNWGCY